MLKRCGAPLRQIVDRTARALSIRMITIPDRVAEFNGRLATRTKNRYSGNLDTPQTISRI